MKAALFLFFVLLLGKPFGSFRIRVDVHLSRKTVDNKSIAFLNFLQKLLAYSHNGGNVHVSGKYGGMRIYRAVSGDEAQHLAFIQKYRFAGSKVVGADYDIFFLKQRAFVPA